MYRGVEFEFRVKPGQKGVDVTVPDEFLGRVGFKYAEIKPLTTSGQARFGQQIRGWKLDPQTVRPITYDARGNVYFGFD